MSGTVCQNQITGSRAASIMVSWWLVKHKDDCAPKQALLRMRKVDSRQIAALLFCCTPAASDFICWQYMTQFRSSTATYPIFPALTAVCLEHELSQECRACALDWASVAVFAARSPAPGSYSDETTAISSQLGQLAPLVQLAPLELPPQRNGSDHFCTAAIQKYGAN